MERPAHLENLTKRLEEIIDANIENEQFGVEDLAAEAGMSRSQLHRKLHSSLGKSPSRFVREYRLQKGMKFLQDDELTVSETAFRVGFGSPTYFSTCFSEYFGYPPGEARIRKSKTPKSHSKTSKSIMVTAGTVLLVAIISILWLTTTNLPEKSIAVLPFKNLSEDPGNQHVADGIMDDILNHLSSISDLKTISRTSSERYRDTNLSLPEIANELEVAYILEGSVQKDGNSARIIVQLIEADLDSHVWSKRYDVNLTDIFAVQSEIAKSIASELSAVITPQEIDRIDLQPTRNLEAHYSYLMGRYYWRQRTQEDLKKSVEYFEMAVALDPEYALAHAGLADAYFIQTWWRWVPKAEGQRKAEQEVLRALELDPDLAEAHATYGGIACYLDWDWHKSEQEFSQAIELKPNYATAHQYYAELLDILGRNREAEMEINRAIGLDPLSVVLYMVKRSFYRRALAFDQALLTQQKVKELRGNEYHGSWFTFSTLTELGRDSEALSEIKTSLSFNDESQTTLAIVDSIYDQNGINGLRTWYIDQRAQSSTISPYDIACDYAQVHEFERSLQWLERAWEKGDPQLPRINNDLRFTGLESNPRFKELLILMGLVDPV